MGNLSSAQVTKMTSCFISSVPLRAKQPRGITMPLSLLNGHCHDAAHRHLLSIFDRTSGRDFH